MQPRMLQVTPQVTPPVTLAVREYGARTSPVHVLMLHGFPDDQTMWTPVVEGLPEDWHVVTMDNRGAGSSSRPRDRASFALAMLVEDVVAVIEETVPTGEQVHLVGHDWGSSLGWDVVAGSTWDPRLEGRLASYTSMSGPPLDHVATRTRTWRGRLRMLPQVLHSWYILAFQVPWIPEHLPWDRAFGPGARHNASGSMNLYRANAPRLLRAAVPWRTSLPVQLVQLRRDRFVTARAFEGLEGRCRRLTRVEVDSGHWLPREDPERCAALLRDFVVAHR